MLLKPYLPPKKSPLGPHFSQKSGKKRDLLTFPKIKFILNSLNLINKLDNLLIKQTTKIHQTPQKSPIYSPRSPPHQNTTNTPQEPTQRSRRGTKKRARLPTPNPTSKKNSNRIFEKSSPKKGKESQRVTNDRFSRYIYRGVNFCKKSEKAGTRNPKGE